MVIYMQDHFTRVVSYYGIEVCCIIVYQEAASVYCVGGRFGLFSGDIIQGG